MRSWQKQIHKSRALRDCQTWICSILLEGSSRKASFWRFLQSGCSFHSIIKNLLDNLIQTSMHKYWRGWEMQPCMTSLFIPHPHFRHMGTMLFPNAQLPRYESKNFTGTNCGRSISQAWMRRKRIYYKPIAFYKDYLGNAIVGKWAALPFNLLSHALILYSY